MFYNYMALAQKHIKKHKGPGLGKMWEETSEGGSSGKANLNGPSPNQSRKKSL